jgi:hypothetical protein
MPKTPAAAYVDPARCATSLKAFNIDTNETFEVRYDPLREFADDTIVPATYYTLDAADGMLMMRYAMCEATSG